MVKGDIIVSSTSGLFSVGRKISILFSVYKEMYWSSAWGGVPRLHYG